MTLLTQSTPRADTVNQMWVNSPADKKEWCLKLDVIKRIFSPRKSHCEASDACKDEPSIADSFDRLREVIPLTPHPTASSPPPLSLSNAWPPSNDVTEGRSCWWLTQLGPVVQHSQTHNTPQRENNQLATKRQAEGIRHNTNADNIRS